jgi:outer membrane receptor protein involved in Fe transport
MSGGSETIDFRVYASDAESDGYIAQPEPYFWQQQDLAGQDWHRRKYGAALAIRPTQGQELTLGVRTYETEMPWVGGRPNYRWDRNGTYYDLGYLAELGDRGSVRVKYLSATIKDHLTWDGLGVNGDPADFTHYMTRQSNEYGDHLEVQANYRVTPANLVTLGISHSIGEISEGEDLAVPADSIAGWDYYSRSDVKAKTQVTGFFAQDELRIAENTLVTIGGRYDRFKLLGNTRYDWDNYGTDERRSDPDSTDGVFNPRLGVRHKLTSATSIYTSYGTAYLPAMSWLRYRSNPACNSPDLNSESSTSYEIGANHDWAGWSTKAAVFHTDYKDKIESQRLVTCTQYVNVASATVDGVELAMEAPRGALWRPYFNYTYNDSRVKSNPADTASEGKRLTQIAKHKFNVGMIYSPLDDLTARLSGRLVGDRYFSSSNHPDSRAAGYFIADFKISYRLALNAGIKDAELSLAVNNLFDKKYLLQKGFAAVGAGVETFRDYGGGRNFWLGLKAGF